MNVKKPIIIHSAIDQKWYVFNPTKPNGIGRVATDKEIKYAEESGKYSILNKNGIYVSLKTNKE